MTPSERTKANARREFFTVKMERDLDEVRAKIAMHYGGYMTRHEEALALNAVKRAA